MVEKTTDQNSGSPTGYAVRRTPWEIAEAWYNAEQIHGCIVRHKCRPPIPADTQSREFAVWLTHEYRLAMSKGVQLGRDGSEDQA